MQADAKAAADAVIAAKDWYPIIVGAISAILSAFGAAFLTLWWQNRKEKRDAQFWLFRTLMANRSAPHLNQESIAAFNLIDIVFYGKKEVVKLWHEYYAMLGNLQGNPDHRHKFLDLLSAMAEHLGYKRIPQTDIDKHYTPQGAINQMNVASSIQEELLRVLKNTNALLVLPRPQPQPQIVDPSTGQPPQARHPPSAPPTPDKQ